MENRVDGTWCDTPREAFASIFQTIAAMPDPEAAKVRQFQASLANVIDEGNALSMPNDVMSPLSEGMTALSENLLTDRRVPS